MLWSQGKTQLPHYAQRLPTPQGTRIESLANTAAQAMAVWYGVLKLASLVRGSSNPVRYDHCSVQMEKLRQG